MAPSKEQADAAALSSHETGEAAELAQVSDAEAPILVFLHPVNSVITMPTWVAAKGRGLIATLPCLPLSLPIFTALIIVL